jgi:hypothetical protein
MTWIGVVVILAILGLVGGLTLAVLPRLREKARREECAKHLKDIGHAVHDFHDAFGYFPTTGSWSDHGIGYDASNQPLMPKYQTAGWAYQILPFLELNCVYRTSDVLYSNGRPINLKPIGPQGPNGVPAPFPDDYAPRHSYFIDLTVGLAGPWRQMPVKVYYCPSRRPTDVYSWNQIGLTD